MAFSSSSQTCSSHLISIDPRVYCESMNELHSYITSSKRGYLTQAELFRYYRQRHDNAEIPYRLLGYRSLLDLLSSDQRLFAIDLHREPAYIYSAVKVRQEKRERRRGTTTFSRQHHSTNTLDGQHVTPPDYVFFDHHVPLNEQQQNVESADEHESSLDTQIDRPLTPDTRNHFNCNNWHTPQLNEQMSSMDKKINEKVDEIHEETIQFVSNPFLALPIVRLSSEMNNLSSLVKHENECELVQRRIKSNDDENNKYLLTKDSTLLNLPRPRVTRSISTSTTSLPKSFPFQLLDLYIFFCTIVVSLLFLGLILYKIC